MKSSSYMDRAMRSSDRRYVRVLEKLGYQRSTMGAEPDFRPADPRRATMDDTHARVVQPAERGEGREDHSHTVSDGDDLTVLRAEYEQLVGKRPFMGWDAAKLREKIAEAKG